MGIMYGIALTVGRTIELVQGFADTETAHE